jgi:putative ABC transport system permease protein
VRWIRADLLARRGQAILEVLVVAGVLTALLLSAAVLEGATNPWRGLFAQSRGAAIWLHLAPHTATSRLRRIDGVTAMAGPYQATAATLVQGPQQSPIELRAMLPRLPDVGRPIVRAGSWLKSDAPDGVVLEASFAQAVDVTVGSRLVIDGIDGLIVQVRVIGIAATSDQGFYPDQTPGLVWGLPKLLRRVEPIMGHTEEVVGLRISDLADTSFVAQQAVAQLGRSMRAVSTYTEVEQSMARGDPLLGLLLALFGLVALGAAVLAIASATGGRVLVQLEDLATLKTLGFTPAQVTGVVVAEHTGLGLAGTALGAIAARELTIPLLLGIPASVLPAVAPLPPVWVIIVGFSTELTVMLAAAFPGWRAGRVRPVAAVYRQPPSGHLSRLARAALLSRFPPAVVLGARAAFIRPLRSTLTVGGLAISVAMIMIGLGVASTVEEVQRDPADIGLAAAVTVSPGELSQTQASTIVHSDPQVAAVYPSVEVSALLPSGTTTITTLGMGTSRRPYPFHVAQGRIYRAPGEAVASQGLLDLLRLRIGQFVPMQINGIPVIFHIVGRIIEPADDGQVLAYGLDTLSAAGAPVPPNQYSLVLRSDVTPAAAIAHLLAVSGHRLDVSETVDPASQLGVVQMMLTGLIAVLGLIGLTSLLTASAVGLRDQVRDVGVLRAMGLTPAQVMVSLVTSTSVLALIAISGGAIAGIAVSSRLINFGAQIYGIGAGIGRPPSAEAIMLTVIVATVTAGLAAIRPARRVAGVPIAAMLAP